MRPRSVLLAFRTIHCIAFCIHFRSEKPTENPSKMRSEPFQNRCRKRVVFQHRFFRVSAWILEGPGTSNLEPSWPFWPKNFAGSAPFYLLKLSVFKKLRLGGLWPRFWKPGGSILEGPGSIFKGFGRLKRCLKAFLGGEHFATDLSCIIGPFAAEK